MSIQVKPSICREVTLILRKVKKNICKTFTVKSYDKSNINEFTLSVWESFLWGFIDFDESWSDIF